MNPFNPAARAPRLQRPAETRTIPLRIRRARARLQRRARKSNRKRAAAPTTDLASETLLKPQNAIVAVAKGVAMARAPRARCATNAVESSGSIATGAKMRAPCIERNSANAN